MDKSAIKNYAVWARSELIERVKQKALQYGITKETTVYTNTNSVNGYLLSETEKAQRRALIAKINKDSYNQVIEEVAYTWFNRFSALRFMEVNGYLPSHVRVFTDNNNSFKPQILDEALNLDLDGLDKDKVYELKQNNKDEELYKYLVITQCNDLNKVLPVMFQKISDYTELLFPDNLLHDGSVIDRMINDIPEGNWNVTDGGQIEIIGWLYQYYITEKHEEVVDPLHGKVVNKDDVPAATQLFTTDWVVRYLIDNSVGKYWIERHPNSQLRKYLKYFVTSKDDKINYINEDIKPEQLTVFDPCMGSAHFGVYAFEVLERIYVECGYSERDAAASIVKNNLFGLDIDERAAQLANFAIMMKAMQYDKRFLTRGIQPQFYCIEESNDVDSYLIDYFANKNSELRRYLTSVLDDLRDAKEYGSIIKITPVNFDKLFNRFEEIKNDNTMDKYAALDVLLPLVREAKMLSSKYMVVATNPPYLNKFDAKLKAYVNNHYKNYSGDLFSVFVYRNFDFCKLNGYSGFMTPFVWMFIKTYESLRKYIINNKAFISLIQFEYSAFEEATVPICSFVLKNGKPTEQAYCFKLSEFKGGMEVQNQKVLEALSNKNCGYFYESNQDNFSKIPGSPIAYWVSKTISTCMMKEDNLKSLGRVTLGMRTGDNERFLHLWYEINNTMFQSNACSADDALNSKKKWFPYNKGGEYRKWYGNTESVVNWENNGFEIKENTRKVYPQLGDNLGWKITSEEKYFHRGIAWSRISSTYFGVRLCENNLIFDTNAPMFFPKNEEWLEYIAGFMCSKIASTILSALNPTLTFQVVDIGNLPIKFEENKKSEVEVLVENNFSMAKLDWDSFETSWDFKRHPLVDGADGISEAYGNWKTKANEMFKQLKSNEEELNKIFIDIYGLQDELKPEEEYKDVTVHYMVDKKEDASESLQKSNYLLTKEDVVKSFMSYAVGCMFGRYSLDVEGLAYAGGQWDESKYTTYLADKDGILPICDNEYFEDDIVSKFVKFVEVVYGEKSLNDNLNFIARALGGKGTSREVIRDYFLNDFYNDHCRIYQKRPIYWLFKSGKKNGFNCLIYMHRYQPDTIAKIRIDYVHGMQGRYSTAISDLERRVKNATEADKMKLNKQLIKIKEQAEEVRIYEEKIHHLADQNIKIDLDDGVKHNYELFEEVLAKIK